MEPSSLTALICLLPFFGLVTKAVTGVDPLAAGVVGFVDDVLVSSLANGIKLGLVGVAGASMVVEVTGFSPSSAFKVVHTASATDESLLALSPGKDTLLPKTFELPPDLSEDEPSPTPNPSLEGARIELVGRLNDAEFGAVSDATLLLDSDMMVHSFVPKTD